MSTRLLVILLDLYAIGVVLTWLRCISVLKEPVTIGELVADLLLVVLWPLTWVIALTRVLVLLVMYEESDS